MIRAQDFDLLSGLVKTASGLALSRDKGYLLESRILPLAQRSGFDSLESLCGALRTQRRPALEADIVEAMTTNESFFFRDATPFERFRDNVLPQLLAARADARRLRIWSAACSNGQEPYSLAMILHELKARLAGWSVDILATDLSREVLERARQGAYTQFEVQRGLPAKMLVMHFDKVSGDKWQLKPHIRQAVGFRSFNLLDDPAPLGRFDVIFCRNVLIYFDLATKRQVLGRMARIMPEDGALFLGGAETVLGVSEAFQSTRHGHGIYAPATTMPAWRAAG